jgi:hypothetical protein
VVIMEVTGNDKVVELFLKAVRELRAMGATRVEGLGFCANFLPPPAERKAPDEQPQRAMSAEARELHERAQRLLGGGQ